MPLLIADDAAYLPCRLFSTRALMLRCCCRHDFRHHLSDADISPPRSAPR
jgi:hypothetical protein